MEGNLTADTVRVSYRKIVRRNLNVFLSFASLSWCPIQIRAKKRVPSPTEVQSTCVSRKKKVTSNFFRVIQDLSFPRV